MQEIKEESLAQVSGGSDKKDVLPYGRAKHAGTYCCKNFEQGLGWLPFNCCRVCAYGEAENAKHEIYICTLGVQ